MVGSQARGPCPEEKVPLGTPACPFATPRPPAGRGGAPTKGRAFEVPSKKRISYGMGRTSIRLASQVDTFPGRSVFREQEEL